MAIKIFIDQGHNPSGPNTGAEGFGLKEQDITYQVGKDLAALLRADERFEGMCYNKTDFVAQAAPETGRTRHRFCKTRGTRAF